MRRARIKIAATESEAWYHCVSRTVNKERLFDEAAKEVLRRQMWQVADYCGVRIVTYAVMSNHFHILLSVPRREPITDAELLRRYKVLYPRPTKYQTARLAVVESELATNGPEAVIWRRRQLALMGDVSQYMKLLKQRFSIWFNKSHQRIGTLWAERFKSSLVDIEVGVRQAAGAYIDLNAVRAGIVTDPKDYRFCGYAEAVAGGVSARQGICSVNGGQTWEEAQAHYRAVLFGIGADPREGAAALSPADLHRVIAEGGRLPPATVLRCRIRYFTDGAVLGTRAFVEQQLAKYREKAGPLTRTAPRPLPSWTNWTDWATLRSLRKQAWG